MEHRGSEPIHVNGVRYGGANVKVEMILSSEDDGIACGRPFCRGAPTHVEVANYCYRAGGTLGFEKR